MSTKRRAKTREIARAAIGPLSTRGARNVTLDELGRSIGMTGAHLLYYFRSKSDLFVESLRVVEDDLRERVLARFEESPSARERWEWLLDAAAPTGLGDSGLLMWLEAWATAVHDDEVRGAISTLEGQWQELLRDTIEYGVERGELPDDVDVDTIVEGVSALLDGLTIRVVVGYRPVGHEEAVAIVNAFTRALLPWREPPG